MMWLVDWKIKSENDCLHHHTQICLINMQTTCLLCAKYKAESSSAPLAPPVSLCSSHQFPLSTELKFTPHSHKMCCFTVYFRHQTSVVPTQLFVLRFQTVFLTQGDTQRHELEDTCLITGIKPKLNLLKKQRAEFLTKDSLQVLYKTF